MKSELKSVLEQIGYDALYERHIDSLGDVNARGERRGRSPFPYLVDRNPSFSVNVSNGRWYCFKQRIGGDYVMFRALMEATEFDPITGYGVPDYSSTERRLLVEFNIAREIDPAYVAHCHQRWLTDIAMRLVVQRGKPWGEKVYTQFAIGYDERLSRIVIPIYDETSRLVNCRLYMPNPPANTPKWIWLESGVGGNFMFPHTAIKEQDLIVVEGEADVLTLRNIGFPACSGTSGARNPVPDADHWRDKRVWILMDDDEAGRDAAQRTIEILKGYVKEMFLCSLPDWEGKPEKADISDYVLYLNQSFSPEEVRSNVTRIFASAERVSLDHVDLDMPATEVTFNNVTMAENISRRLKFEARLLAIGANRFVLPTSYRISCPAGSFSYCSRCPMYTRFAGNHLFSHDARLPDTLSLVQLTHEQQQRNIKKSQGIPKDCDAFRMAVEESVTVEPVMLGDSLVGDGMDMQQREAMLVLKDGKSPSNSGVYNFDGFVYPHPKTQSAMPLIGSFERVDRSKSDFVVDESSISLLLNYYAEPGNVWNKLWWIASQYESITGIYGRSDLHIAYLSTFLGPLSFNIGEFKVPKGWIEMLVLGDTRCGKSQTFKKLSQHFSTGTLVDCKLQTVPGILGSVQKAQSGEYYAVAGIYPINDGGIVCFDEFAVKHQGGSLIEAMSSTRAEGLVRISKAARAEYLARVRSIWLCNPGQGELVDELPYLGVELINRVISQPEDIARFDMSMVVSQSDVDQRVLHDVETRKDFSLGIPNSLALMDFARSLKPSDIVFPSESVHYLSQMSEYICSLYDHSIPVVEPGDQKTRIAKLAVSFAIMTFSYDPQENKLVVTPEHIHCAVMFMVKIYNSPSFGYDVYSRNARYNKVIADEKSVTEIFDEVVKPYGSRLCEILLHLDYIDPRTFSSLIPISAMVTNNIVGQLSYLGCIRPSDHGRKGMFRKTPAFVAWLKSYLSRGTI